MSRSGRGGEEKNSPLRIETRYEMSGEVFFSAFMRMTEHCLEVGLR